MEVDETVAVNESYEPAGPKPIKKLSKAVVNQIAAAEIIHRPSNAIKELIENSLDAGSTSIKLTIKDGGLKLIQITDNGHGINRSDLPLLCTRFATSKLAKFSDLQTLATYGFRGEALASISYCAHVEVVTKPKSDGCGWKAQYADGELVSSKPGTTADPKPAAANDGTVISAEDLFFNMPLRKRAFRSPSDEYNRILDVIMKYAVHNPHVAWVCKKAGTALSDISTPAASSAKTNIGLLYTPSLAADLVEVPLTVLKPEYKLGATVKGWVSNANTNWVRKGGWLFFINQRLVDSGKVKKALDSLYTAYLPKGASPWVYLSLEIDPTKVDVNVHPTKSDVHFLNEDEMIEAIVGAVQHTLATANVSRSFSVQTLLPGAVDPDHKCAETTTTHAKSAPNYKVRMDPTNRTLDSMLAVLDPSQLSAFASVDSIEDRPFKRRAVGDEAALAAKVGMDGEDEEVPEVEKDDMLRASVKARDIAESVCAFNSISNLRDLARKKSNLDVAEILQKHAFVGIVDRDLSLSLVQHSTKLYLVEHASLGDEHFYQLGLRQFGSFHRLRLEPAPEIRELLRLAAEDERGIAENGLDLNEVSIAGSLLDKREMLDEYFSLSLSLTGRVETLPMLLKGYTPNLDRLPHFLLCLGTQVDWEDEQECFRTFLGELAFFYSPRPFSNDETEAERSHQNWQLEHVLFPSFRRYTSWPRDMLGREIRQVANLPDLFRVFERC
ncbi:MAG: DNA mismatch repair protein [Tremellales sp. Tagirdzhanova-0007]|nr:MAG: DNA mismatch repair protein [Tremellales sp. Tagirdzhanova-0007]